MSRVHHLDEYDPNIVVSGYKLERIKSCKLLGVHINEHLKWDDHITHTVSILRKLKYLAKYELRKQLVETLILSILSVTMSRTFGMYLKSDGFQSMREEI